MTFYKGVAIRIENKQEGEYHYTSFPRKVLNSILRPILNHVPEKYRFLVRRSHKQAAEVIDKATTHEALEVLYKKGTHGSRENFFSRIVRQVWFGTENALAIYNRLILVKKKFLFFANKGSATSILSIASGSARAIIESLPFLQPNINPIRISFLDKNPKALEHSKLLLSKQGDANFRFRFLNDTASNFINYYEPEENLDIIEMVGLLDYFQDAKIKELLSLIYQKLATSGVLITANIADNPERPFVTNLVGWKMIYRRPEQLINLALASGFQPENLEIIFEPNMIHFILIARK